MAEPIEWRIFQHLQTALRGIAMSAGYHFDVAALAVKLDPDQKVEDLIAPGGPRPFLILQPQPDAWTYAEKPNRVHMVMPITVHWVSTAVPTDDDSRLLTYLRGCADVEQAIAMDITRGDLAVDTRIVSRQMDLAVGGSQVWAMVDLEIALRRTYGVPNA